MNPCPEPNPGAPLVSVVMAVRDGAAHLAQSVSSILAQDMPDFELVVVDDGSRDGSPDILAGFAAADPRVRVLRLERAVGLPGALNVSLDAARGRFIARHDDDDVAQPWRLRVQTEFMDRHPCFAICGGMARVIDRHGRLADIAVRPLGERGVVHMLGAGGRNAVVHSSVLMRSDIGLRYRDRFTYAQDYDLLLRAVTSGLRIFNLPHVLLHLRVHAARQTAVKQFRQIMYRRAAHRFYEERLTTGTDSYETHDFSACEPPRLDDLVEPEQVTTAARLQFSAFVTGAATRWDTVTAASRALSRGRSRALAGVMAAVAFAPRPLLRAVRRLKRILIAERPPRCSTAVIASLGGGVATWQATGTVMRELRVYEELCRRGLPVTLYTFDRPADVADLDTPVRIVPGTRFRLPGRLSAAYALSWAVTRRTAGRRHAALITNQAHAGWPAIVLGRVWRTPVIARCGYVFSEQAATMGWHDRRARRRAAWEAWTHRHAAISFLPTDDLIAWCRSHMPGFESCRVRRVPNAIDTNLFAPRPRTPVATDVLAVGRLHPEKRLSLLVAAAATIPGLRLTFVGDGPDRGLLEAEAARHGVTVRFIARVGNEELPALYRNSAAFAIVSVREGNPKALLEAMACGCACIGTEAPGIRNVIRHGVSGLLCGSTPLEVAAAIRAVLGDRDLRERLGAVAREQVVCENSLPHILAIYEDAIVSLATGEPLWPPRVTNGAAV